MKTSDPVKHDSIEQALRYYQARAALPQGHREVTGQHIAEHLEFLQAYCQRERLQPAYLKTRYSVNPEESSVMVVLEVIGPWLDEQCDYHSIALGMACIERFNTSNNFLIRFSTMN